MSNTDDKCPYCGCSLKNNSSTMICMNCGHSLTHEKHFDKIDSQKIGEKDNNATNMFFSLGALWRVLLIFGSIVAPIVSLELLFDFL